MRLLTWNMNHRPEAWDRVRSLAATEGVQVALLQEAPLPPRDFTTSPSAVGAQPWAITAPRAPSRNWRSVVAVPDGTEIALETLDLPPAAEMNIWRGEGTWRSRYQTVFDRFEAEGFTFAGPFGADGRSTVPTYAHRGHPPRHQTDFVFVKGGTATCTVLDDWTPSDHAPITIDVR